MSLAEPQSATDRAAQLVELASFFTERGDHAAAAELFALALRIDPQSQSARSGLAAVRRAQRKAPAGPGTSLREAALEEMQADSADAFRFVGLARLYAHKRELRRALECLEIAEAKAPTSPEAPKLAGRLLFECGALEEACESLSRALALDPFDRQTAETLGLALYRQRKLPEAAAATIHAFLLLREMESDTALRLRGRLLTLKRLLHWKSADFQTLFHERRDLLNQAFARLEGHREQFLVESSLPRGGALFGPPPRRRRGAVLELALRLRRGKVFSALSDENLVQLTSTLREEVHEQGSLVFGQEGGGRDLYIVESGRVAVERATSYGTFTLRSFGPGDIFGEEELFVPKGRGGDAMATETTSLLRVEAPRLDSLVENNLELAGQLYWCLWHTLAAKLRDANEQLRQIFQAEGGDNTAESTASLWKRRTPTRVQVDPEAKREIFRQQGLSHRDLITLATFSREKRFEPGEFLFREGDPGDELYAVVEGRVLISKHIPGAGDEALAILQQGEFFGEMALIDGKPRSADALAESGPVTVLALDGSTLRDLFTLDVAASLEFLHLLCRLLAQRLREADDKGVTWHILAGHWGDSETYQLVGQAR